MSDILEKLYNRIHLTEDDLSELVYEYSIDSKILNERRWTKRMSSIIKHKDKLFNIEWEKGLTQNIDDEFHNQPYEVKQVKKLIEIIEYEKMEEE